MAKVYRFKGVPKYMTIDACSIQNICASSTFLNKSMCDGYEYSIPEYALYEAVKKPLSTPDASINKRRASISEQVVMGRVRMAQLSIDDLQEMAQLKNDKPGLGNGELACIVYSRNKQLSVLTDDKTARNYAKKVLGDDKAYETAEVLANMVFEHTITDSECLQIIEEEKESRSNMDIPYSEAYKQALLGMMYERK